MTLIPVLRRAPETAAAARPVATAIASLTLVVVFGLVAAAAEPPAPIIYTVRVSAPETQYADVEALVPTEGRDRIELMMPVWSPGYYKVEDYASRVDRVSARGPDGVGLRIEQPRSNRWRIETKGVSTVTVAYRVLCEERTVTTNWVDRDVGVFNGAPTFMTLADGRRRPHEVRLERPPTWPRSMSGLADAPGARPDRYLADDYEALVDSPILAGALDVQEFEVHGSRHLLVSVSGPSTWDSRRAAADLATMVREVDRFWGSLPFDRYAFLVVFRPSGGGLEHRNSTLINVSPERMDTPNGYRGWLGLATHEYFHAFNVKRLRPVELGPFDFEASPRSTSLWWSEGVTSYFSALTLVRAGLTTPAEFLASLGSAIGQLQASPGRLLQTVEQSSADVWNNSLSGVNPDQATVSYYTKGEVIGFLLDARIRHLTNGARSLDDVMRLSYARYSGARGFTPEQLRDVANGVAGVSLDDWFRRALSTTAELDYDEAFDWFGVRLVAEDAPAEPGREARKRSRLVERDTVSDAQRQRLLLLCGRPGA